MKLLNKTILEISKFLLLFNLILIPIQGFSQTSDRFLIRIVDKTISLKDLHFELRNLKALNCAYPNSIIRHYFGAEFLGRWQNFLNKMPTETKKVSLYLYDQDPFLKELRLYLKLLRYSQDQRAEVTPELNEIMMESLRVNNCGKDIFYKNRLKTTFYAVLRSELYLKSRYGNQLSDSRNAGSVKSSIDLFMESLDKQFYHEYYR